MPSEKSEASHPVCIFSCSSEFFNQRIIGNRTYRCTDNRNQLGHFSQVNIIAVFLLKCSPVKLVNIVREILYFIIPIHHLNKDIFTMSGTGESQLKYVQYI